MSYFPVQEVRNYPAILDCLEEEVRASTAEAKELRLMTDKAIKAGEDARVGALAAGQLVFLLQFFFIKLI